jgi:hypothetical protein
MITLVKDRRIIEVQVDFAKKLVFWHILIHPYTVCIHTDIHTCMCVYVYDMINTHIVMIATSYIYIHIYIHVCNEC